LHVAAKQGIIKKNGHPRPLRTGVVALCAV
jgi:hypothetical protein